MKTKRMFPAVAAEERLLCGDKQKGGDTLDQVGSHKEVYYKNMTQTQ